MKDSYEREISYLRISLTDLCNLRCTYCMPAEGVCKFEHSKIISVDEIEEISRCAVSLGVKKIRLTGGEPMVRRGIIEICQRLSAIDGLEELCLTTNGLMLSKYARDLALAGVTRINVSMDSMIEEKFKRITRCTYTDEPVKLIFEGMEKCNAYGVPANKINVVLMGGINDDEIVDFVELTKDRDLQVRFIELMPIGEAADWDKSVFIPNTEVLKCVPELEAAGESGVSLVYKVPGYKGSVGLISTISNHFCSKCSRLRLTADGKLKACLHSNKETPVKGLTGDALYEAIKNEIKGKPENFDLTVEHHSDSGRNMNQIGG